MILNPKSIVDKLIKKHIFKVKDQIPIPIKLAIMQINKTNEILNTQITFTT